ncbi:MAG: PQQ-binding-like beta-propeller repeat protein [Rubripirellula sp.]
MIVVSSFIGSTTTVARAHDNAFLPSGSHDIGWPNVRGPKYDGKSPEIHIADEWPADGPPVLWIKELGQGYSSFVVQDDRAYTQYQSLAGQYVLCLNANTGETLWSYRYDWPFEATGLYPGPRSTPTIAANHIFFATPAGDVGCLDGTGRLKWRRELKQEFDGKGTGFGYACSPTVVDGKVLMPVGGTEASMVALNAENGDVLWTSGSASASYTPAFPIEVDGRRQVIGYLEHELVSFDIETGEALWNTVLSRGYDEHSAWPIFDGEHLWCSAPFQSGSQLFRLLGGDSPSLQRVWQSTTMSNDVSSSVAVDGHLFGFDLAEAQTKAHRPSRGSFKCVEFLTGDTKWINGDPRERRSTSYEENAKSQTIGHASLLAVDGKLILFNDLGDLILARADAQQYLELGRAPALPGEISWTAPAMDRGRVFLRNHSRAVCIYIGDPDLLDRTRDVSRIADVPRGRPRDFSRLLGVEPEYAMDPPTQRWLWTWYAVSIAILLGAAILSAGFAGAFRLWRRPESIRLIYWGLTFSLGLVTGSVVSMLTNDFVFTWPVCLFIACQTTLYHAKPRHLGMRSRRDLWRDRVLAVGFLVVCMLYLWVCRRLSLVTEWVFLCGLMGGIPFLLAGRRLTSRGLGGLAVELAMTLLGFSGFYALSVLILSWKYELNTF